MDFTGQRTNVKYTYGFPISYANPTVTVIHHTHIHSHIALPPGTTFCQQALLQLVQNYMSIHHNVNTHVQCRNHQPFTTGMEENPATRLLYGTSCQHCYYQVLRTYTHTHHQFTCQISYSISSVRACIPHVMLW